ncbi:MAG: CRTAC1 family protein [Myxococcota bacterium]
MDAGASSGAGLREQDSTGVCFGDIDNDGDHDLYVLGNAEPNRMLLNDGRGRFTDITAASGTGAGHYTATSCSFGDIDNDGLLDLVVANSWNWRTTIGITTAWASEEHNQLFRNRGSGAFEDVSASSGIQNMAGFPAANEGFPSLTWAISMVDIDLDGDVDILFADDQGSVPQEGRPGGVNRGFFHLFENDGLGHFIDKTIEKNLNQPGGWMSLDFGDLNCDGRLDFFSGNFSDFTSSSQSGGRFVLGAFPSRWYLANADGTFTAPPLGELITTPFGWGGGIFDYDGDGDLDIVYHGGMDLVLAVDASNGGVVLQNQGCSARFVRDTEALDPRIDHRRRNVQGVAIGDLDGNGFDDIVSVSSFDTPVSVPILPVPNNPAPNVFGDAGFFGTFRPGAVPGQFVFTGIEFEDGTLSVELNGGTQNRMLRVEVLGSIGLTSEGLVNRDGIGAVVTVTPVGRRAPAATSRPVLGGSSYASQHSLAMNFGLGRANRAHVEVLWPGGNRTRVYNVKGRTIIPEIPCRFDDPSGAQRAYRRCVRRSLTELYEAGAIDQKAQNQLRRDAMRAWRDAH